MKKIQACVALAWLGVVLPVACGSDNGQSAVSNTGKSCSADNQCFRELGDASLSGGAALCLTRVPGGYCTHHCGVDSDCCAVHGECANSFPELCAPFESTGDMLCFLSCEDAVIKQAGLTDSNAFCQKYATPAFICRSTGGGAKNRKVCVPN